MPRPIACSNGRNVIPMSYSSHIMAPTASASVDAFIEQLKNPDHDVSGAACQGAATCGAPAVEPLGRLLDAPDFELARRTKRALYHIVRHAGRPGAEKERAAVEGKLISLLEGPSANIRRQALWMLSEIGGNKSIKAMSALLMDPEAREDARCALMRLPGRKVTAAFKTAFAQAPEEFKYALAESLRLRGERIDGYPSRKKIPTANTTVVALAPKTK